MKFFKKESDMKCSYCKKLISHKKVNWEPRKVDTFIDEIRELEKSIGNKGYIASPIEIFGFYEYEYLGRCPKCNAELNVFWFGLESLSRNKDIAVNPKPFSCHECKKRIKRESRVWYSFGPLSPRGPYIEFLLTICPRCKTENEYPFEYHIESNLKHRIVK